MVRAVVTALVLLLSAAGVARADTQCLSLPVRIDGDGVVVRAVDGMGGVAKRVAKRAPGALDAIYADLAACPEVLMTL